MKVEDLVKGLGPDDWILAVPAESESDIADIMEEPYAGWLAYPVCYTLKYDGISMPLMQARKRGHNRHHAKNPLGCKAFMQFLEQTGYLQSDIVLIKADDKL